MKLGKKLSNDQVFHTEEIFVSKDYSKFVLLEGNRDIDPKHVQRLINQIKNYGNLTDKFPIVVNDKLEILDGQHRYTALMELGEPLMYVVKPNVGIDEVRNVNTTHRNWGWLDYAKSYADLGNEHYKELLELNEDFPYGYGVLMTFTDSQQGKNHTNAFYSGQYKIADVWEARENLEMYKEVRELTENTKRQFAIAFREVLKSPEYSHKRMMLKLEKYGDRILQRAQDIKEYRRALEDIYNKGQRPSSITRFW